MPSPRLTIRVDIPPASDAVLDLSALPSRPGVFLFEDEDGRTIVIGMTADLRRQVRTRLAPPPETEPSRRVDYRAVARTVRALTVGSAFEADWTYLQLARERLPHTCPSLFDRWRGWFVHCDVDAPFPRFTKVSTSEIAAKSRDGHRDTGEHIGPFADKHDAQRAIERLESAFDLCRFHHILKEAPHATACAYKEMGKCPAPCDGSITMDAYRGMMRDAIVYTAGAPNAGSAALEREMQAASNALDFERAERLRQRLETLSLFDRPAFAHVERLTRFRFIAVLPGENAAYARLMTIVGGRIEPWADLPLLTTDRALAEVLDDLNRYITLHRADDSAEAVETIGLVCWHLFRPAKARGRADLLSARDGVDRNAVKSVLKRLRALDDDDITKPEVSEGSLDSL